MKKSFICGVLIGLGGCIDLQADPLPADETGSANDDATAADDIGPAGDDKGDDDDVGDDDDGDDGDDTGSPGCTNDCPMPHGLFGELMLFVNGRLSSPEALYQSNIPLDGSGRYLGPAIFVYDPLRECEGGGNACRVAKLGNLRLDERLGEISVDDGSLQKFTLRDVAWSPDHGLWAVTFDVKNDEWGIAQLHVTDWTLGEQDIELDRWTLLPSTDPGLPTADPCYWQESVTGLAFFGDELLLGVRGLGGVGITNHGGVFRIDRSVLDDGWCVYQNDLTQDPHYYACAPLCQWWARYEPAIGVAGDLVRSRDASHMLAMTRGENGALPLGRQELYRIDPPPVGELASPVGTSTYLDGVDPGLDLEGLAWVGGRLFVIDVWARVWELDEVQQTVNMHDDLGPLFEDSPTSVRIRGAASVVIAER